MGSEPVRRRLGPWIALALLAGVAGAQETGLEPVRAPIAEPPVRVSVAREWSVREAAATELFTGFDGARWTDRADRLRAIARRLASLPEGVGEPELDTVAVGLVDPHPSVRARALEGLALARAAGAEHPLTRVELTPELLAGPLGSPLPAERLALARALEVPARSGGSAAEVTALSRLVGDPDPTVRSAAFQGLVGHAPRSALARVSLAHELSRRARSGAGRELVEGFEVLFRRGSPAEVWAELAGGLADAGPGARALAAAGSVASGGPVDAETLLLGWFPARALDVGADELLAHATLRGGEELGAALLQGAHELAEIEPQLQTGAALPATPLFQSLEGYLAQRGGAVERLGLEWIEAAVRTLGTERALALAPDLLRGPQSRRLLLAATATETAWPLEPTRRLLALTLPGPERIEFASALETAAYRADPVALELLVRLTAEDDPDLSREAFRIVASSSGVGDHLGPLAERWRELPFEERVERIGLFAGDVAPGPFTDDLLELGEHHDELRLRLARWLSRGPYGERVHIELARWLVTELAARAEGRDAEAGRRAAALLVELDRFAGEAAHGDLTQAVRLLPADEDVGRAAATRLARTGAGRERLAGLIELDLVRRTELEIALALAGAELSPAERAARRDTWLPVLLDNTDRRDPELAGRVFDALARSGDEAGAEALAAIALDSLEGEAYAQAALTALGACAHPAAVEALELAARRTGGHDRRVSAGRSLASCPAPGAQDRLVRLANDVGRARVLGLGEQSPAEAADLSRELGLDLLVPDTGEELEHLAEELERACVRCGRIGQRAIEELFLKAVSRAEEDLVARHGRTASSPVEFRYRRELELAAALASRPELVRALEPLEAVGARLDPAFLLRLAEVLAAGGRGAEARGLARLAALAFDPFGTYEELREQRSAHRLLADLEAAAGAESAAEFHRQRVRSLSLAAPNRSDLEPVPWAVRDSSARADSPFEEPLR